jgi:ectoine hydroxylase-related dioxygenase (phytanoyl-CoA dioxygenase family)
MKNFTNTTGDRMTSWTPDPAAWQADYRESGYLVVENVIEPDILREMRAELDRIEQRFAAGELPPSLASYITTDANRSRVYGVGQGGSTISNIMELAMFAPVFRDSILNPRMLDVLEAIFESSEFAFHNLKAICKMPHNDTPFQWHRDLPYLKHTTSNLITCMLCVDDMTVANGATVVCPGTHRLADEDVADSDRNIPEAEVPQPRVTVECPAGSAVLFHVNIIHGGGPNHSETKRRNAISIWGGPGCLPITRERYAYEFLKPRSADPMYQKQIDMTFNRG